MPRLEIEITDKLMGRLQERAEVYAVEPSDVVKSIISFGLARREEPSWVDKLSAMVSDISQAAIAISKMRAEKSEQK